MEVEHGPALVEHPAGGGGDEPAGQPLRPRPRLGADGDLPPDVEVALQPDAGEVALVVGHDEDLTAERAQPVRARRVVGGHPARRSARGCRRRAVTTGTRRHHRRSVPPSSGQRRAHRHDPPPSASPTPTRGRTPSTPARRAAVRHDVELGPGRPTRPTTRPGTPRADPRRSIPPRGTSEPSPAPTRHGDGATTDEAAPRTSRTSAEPTLGDEVEEEIDAQDEGSNEDGE